MFLVLIRGSRKLYTYVARGTGLSRAAKPDGRPVAVLETPASPIELAIWKRFEAAGFCKIVPEQHRNRIQNELRKRVGLG